MKKIGSLGDNEILIRIFVQPFGAKIPFNVLFQVGIQPYIIGFPKSNTGGNQSINI